MYKQSSRSNNMCYGPFTNCVDRLVRALSGRVPQGNVEPTYNRVQPSDAVASYCKRDRRTLNGIASLASYCGLAIT